MKIEFLNDELTRARLTRGILLWKRFADVELADKDPREDLQSFAWTSYHHAWAAYTCRPRVWRFSGTGPEVRLPNAVCCKIHHAQERIKKNKALAAYLDLSRQREYDLNHKHWKSLKEAELPQARLLKASNEHRT